MPHSAGVRSEHTSSAPAEIQYMGTEQVRVTAGVWPHSRQLKAASMQQHVRLVFVDAGDRAGDLLHRPVCSTEKDTQPMLLQVDAQRAPQAASCLSARAACTSQTVQQGVSAAECARSRANLLLPHRI